MPERHVYVAAANSISVDVSEQTRQESGENEGERIIAEEHSCQERSGCGGAVVAWCGPLPHRNRKICQVMLPAEHCHAPECY